MFSRILNPRNTIFFHEICRWLSSVLISKWVHLRENNYKCKIQDSWKHVMSTYIVTFFGSVIDSNKSPNTSTKNCPTSLRNNFVHSKWTGFKKFSNTDATKFVFAIVFGLIVRQGFIFKIITLIVNQVVCWINRGSPAGPIKMEPTKIEF